MGQNRSPQVSWVRFPLEADSLNSLCKIHDSPLLSSTLVQSCKPLANFTCARAKKRATNWRPSKATTVASLHAKSLRMSFFSSLKYTNIRMFQDISKENTVAKFSVGLEFKTTAYNNCNCSKPPVFRGVCFIIKIRPRLQLHRLLPLVLVLCHWEEAQGDGGGREGDGRSARGKDNLNGRHVIGYSFAVRRERVYTLPKF